MQVTTHSDGTVQKTATMSDGSHDVIDDEASDDEVGGVLNAPLELAAGDNFEVIVCDRTEGRLG